VSDPIAPLAAGPHVVFANFVAFICPIDADPRLLSLIAHDFLFPFFSDLPGKTASLIVESSKDNI
jgi:hypothetical protein